MGRPAAPPEERATDPRTNPHARPGKACIHAHSNPLRDRLCGTKLNRNYHHYYYYDYDNYNYYYYDDDTNNDNNNNNNDYDYYYYYYYDYY